MNIEDMVGEEELPGVAGPVEGHEFHSITVPQFADEHRDSIRCMIVFPVIREEPIPFVATADDTSAHGKKVFQEIMDGKWGPIADPCPVAAQQRLTTSANANRSSGISETDWLVSRHRDELDAGSGTTLAVAQFKELQQYRQALRDWPNHKDFPAGGQPVAPAWLK